MEVHPPVSPLKETGPTVPRKGDLAFKIHVKGNMGKGPLIV